MTLGAVVLAGGRSRRMGRDKALLPGPGGDTLLERQVALVREVGAERVRVSVRPGQRYKGFEEISLEDAWPGAGPLGGIATALREHPGTHLLAVAVDLPHLTAPLLQKMWRACGPGCGVAPNFSDGLEPLVAIYPAEALGEAEDRLRTGRLRMREFAVALARRGQLREIAWDEGERELFRNWNAPSDLPGMYAA